MSSPRFSDSLASREASGGSSASRSAIAVVCAISSACATSHWARPKRNASSAVIGYPMATFIAWPFPDPSGQPNNPAVVRQYAQSDLRQPPLGAIGSDDQIAAISDDAADADCIAVDRGDDRLGKFTQHLASRAMALG